MCYLARQPRTIFTSHNFGDSKCPSLSANDRKIFRETARLAIVKEDTDEENINEEEFAELYGYENTSKTECQDDNQVVDHEQSKLNNILISRNESVKHGFIQPIPSQILTVFLDEQCKIPFHIELDSGATVSYVREDIVIKHNFEIIPNNQISKLGDGYTKQDWVAFMSQPY